MNNNKIIETLNDLISYIEDQWDWEDDSIKKEAEQDIEALQQAITIIQSKNIVGTLNIKDKIYTIVK